MLSASTMEIVERVPLIDEALDAWRDALGAARDPYRGHAYRVFNVARQVLGRTDEDDAIALSSVFHDIGIWTDRTFDYLPPSIARAEAYRSEFAPAIDGDVVARAIDHHHALRRYTRPPKADVVEAFRRADLVDVSAGLVRAGVPRAMLVELRAHFPYAGFHGLIVREALFWFVRHPLRPFPVLRWS
jgi:hypothetical protein